MDLDLEECNARRAWATKQLWQLRKAINDYEESDPYELRQEFAPAACTSSLYITPRTVPMDISFMAGDVLHNLRSTLDHLAWQLALSTESQRPTFPLDDASDWRRVFFPLRSKFYATDDWLPKRLRYVSPDIKVFLREIQPYVMAEDPRDSTLWKLNELSNVDKHRVALIAVPSLYQTDTLTVTTPLSHAKSRILDLARVPLMLEGETLLVRVTYDTIPLSTPNLELTHAVRVAFHDSLGIGLGMWVVDMLDMMEAMVEYILTRAEQIGEKSSSADNDDGATGAAPTDLSV